jgi:hypothetical protein
LAAGWMSDLSRYDSFFAENHRSMIFRHGPDALLRPPLNANSCRVAGKCHVMALRGGRTMIVTTVSNEFAIRVASFFGPSNGHDPTCI